MNMKKQLKMFFAIAAVSAALLTGCMRKVKYPSYYTLRLNSVADPPSKGAQLPAIAVQEFRSPAYLREGPIVYLISPQQIGFYEYHRWAIDPPRVVTKAIIEHLRGNGEFAQVKYYDGRTDCDYILSGHLDRLEEIDYEGGVQVLVELSAQVLEIRTGKTVWSNSVSDKAIVKQRTVPGVVAEMSIATDQAIEKLLQPLKLPPAAAGQ